MLDHDGDEKIHVDEVMLIMSTGMGKEIGMNENVVQSVMDNIDRDKNGELVILLHPFEIIYLLIR